MTARGGRSDAEAGLEGVSNRVIAELLARIAANAFTMTTTELQPLGIGLFPLAAMVNHACRYALLFTVALSCSL